MTAFATLCAAIAREPAFDACRPERDRLVRVDRRGEVRQRPPLYERESILPFPERLMKLFCTKADIKRLFE
jgi:hypothetical protein